ncbi:MAG: hypothetical protein CSA96_06545 [Bacteroidetes bacterium]|nr:MAG: hypothetical protein CSA96_06545 [Bacteroidota bacterium]
MKKGILTTLFLSFFLFLFFAPEAEAQTVVFDQEIYWEHPIPKPYGGYGFYWWHRTDGGYYNINYGSMPSDNWSAYYNGEWTIRFEILDMPSSEPFTIQFGIWQDQDKGGAHPETVSGQQQIVPGSVYSASLGSPSSWWNKEPGDPVDFSRPGDFYRIGLVLWNPNPLCLLKGPEWGGGGCPENAYKYFPMRARVTVTATGGEAPPVDPPSYGIDYQNERSDAPVSSDDEYAYNADFSDAVSGSGAYLGLTPGQNVYFRKKADHSKTQTLEVPSRAAAPSFSINFQSEATNEAVSNAHEFASANDFSDAQDGNGNPVSIVPGQSLFIRTKATSSAFASETLALTPPARPAAPDFGIDFTNEVTTLAIPETMEYASSADMSEAVQGVGTPLSLSPGNELFFRYRATASDFASEQLHLEVPERPATPTYSIDYANETTAEAVSSSDDYSPASDMSGASAGNNEVLTLTPGSNLYFRTRATSNSFQSDIQTLVVPGRAATPSFSINFIAETTNEAAEDYMAYSTQADMSNPEFGGGDPIALNPGTDLYIRQESSAAGFQSDIQHLQVPEREAAPAFGFEYLTEQTSTAVGSDHEYADNSDFQNATSGNGEPAPVIPGQILYIRLKATAVAFASASQQLDIPARPEAPEIGIDFVAEETDDVISSSMEYATLPDMSDAVSGDGTAIAVAPNADIYIRYIATPSSFSSEIQHLDAPGRSPTPAYSIDFDHETTFQTIDELDEYSNDPGMAGATAGSGTVLALTPGSTVYFRTTAGTHGFLSEIQTLEIPARPETPAFSIDYLNESTLESLNNTFEYASRADMADAVSGTGSPAPLNPGNHSYFRQKASASEFRSGIQDLDVPGRPQAPEFDFDYLTEETTTSVGPGYEYAASSDFSDAITGNDNPAPVVPGQAFYIRAKSSTTSFASEAQVLAIPSRPDAPAVGINYLTEKTDVPIPETMAFSADADMTEAETGTGMPLDVPPGTQLYFRYHASSSSFASHIQHLDAPERGTPAFNIDFEEEQTVEILTANDEYATNIEMSGARTGTGTRIAISPGTSLYFRSKASATAYMTLVQTLVVPERPELPNFEIDYQNERTSSIVSSGFEYSSTSDMQNALNGTGSHVDLTPGKNMYFRVRSGASSFHSEIQTLIVPGRSAAPNFGIDFMEEETTPALGSEHEYASNIDFNGAISGNGNPAPLIPGESMYIRFRALSDAFASEAQHLVVPARPDRPSIGIDYVRQRTDVSIPASIEYSLQSNMHDATAGSDDYLQVPPQTNLYFRVIGTTTTFKSDVQHLSSPARPAKPAFEINYALEQTKTAAAENVEYSTQSDMSNSLISDGDYIPLTPGQDFYFRFLATTSSYDSDIQHLSVPSRRPAPGFGFSYESELILPAISSNYEYADNPEMTNALSGTNNRLSVIPGQPLYIRQKAGNNSFASETQMMDIPSRPVLSSSDTDTTGSNPLVLTLTYPSNMSDFVQDSLKLENASLLSVTKISEGDDANVYELSLNCTEGAVRAELAANAIPQGSFRSEPFSIYYKAGYINGLQESGSLSVKLYPNPNAGRLFLESNQEAGRLQYIWIYNVTGSLVHTGRLDGQYRAELNLEGLEKGIYFLRVDTQKTRIHSKFQLYK